MRFTKLHGAGNDYLYIKGRTEDRDWPALSVAISDRHKGVGADGIILAAPSDQADLRMIMFNADGSEGLMCGNGIRCLVRFAFDQGILTPGETTIDVETASGLRQVEPIWENGVMSRARVSMGEPGLRADEIPATAPGHESITDYRLNVDGHAFDISCVSMGNPHAVAFTDVDVDSLPLAEAGPLVEHHPMFPERVNFEIVNLIDSSRVKAPGMGAWVGVDRGVRHGRLRCGGLCPSARLRRRRCNGEPPRWRPVHPLARQGRGHPGGPRRTGLRRRVARLARSKSPVGPPRTKFSVLVSFSRCLYAPPLTCTHLLNSRVPTL